MATGWNELPQSVQRVLAFRSRIRVRSLARREPHLDMMLGIIVIPDLIVLGPARLAPCLAPIAAR